MKLMSSLLVLISATVAFAQAPDVQVTSFVRTGSSTTTAELCGQVKGLSGLGVVKVVVDERTGRPGIYRTVVEGSEAFCLIVATTTGTAAVSVTGSAVTQALTETSVSELGVRPLPAPRPQPKPWHCRAHRWDQAFPEYSGYPSSDRWQAERSAISACQARETKYCNATCSQY